MPIKIVHTADVHLDTTFGVLGERKGHLKREAVRKTMSRIIDGCLEWNADILVIAGDLFEEARVTPETMGFLQREFSRLGKTPVVIAPGNHDPYTSRSRYAVTDWPANVYIFRQRTISTFEFEDIGLEVRGVAHDTTHMPGRLVDVAGKAEKTAPCTILVCHACEESSAASDKSSDDIWLPFTRDEVARLGYSYVALGHYHGPYEITDAGRLIAAYSGCPEGLRASEQGRRSYSRVTLDGDSVTIERVGVSHIDFMDYPVSCEGLETAAQFHDKVSKLGANSPGSIIARVKATGRVAPGFDIGEGLRDELSSLFFHVSVDDETVPAYDWDAIAGERSLRGEVARRFADEIDAAAGEERRVLEKARLYAMDALEGRPIGLPPEVRSVD